MASASPISASVGEGGARLHPWARLLAWLIDWCVIIGWAAMIAAVGVPLYLSGTMRGLPLPVANLLSAVVLVAPVTLGFAWLEAGPRGATLGKRVLRLRVTGPRRDRVGYARALLRNALKIAAPWLVGHAAVYAIVATSATAETPAWVWVLTGAAYVLPLVWGAFLFFGPGRPPYDRAAGTTVRVSTR